MSKSIIIKYLYLSVCYSGEICTYELDVWRDSSFNPSGPECFAAKQADIIFGCYPGTERVECFYLQDWNGKAPAKYMVQNWISNYRHGYREFLEKRITGHWTFIKKGENYGEKTRNPA